MVLGLLAAIFISIIIQAKQKGVICFTDGSCMKAFRFTMCPCNVYVAHVISQRQCIVHLIIKTG